MVDSPPVRTLADLRRTHQVRRGIIAVATLSLTVGTIAVACGVNYSSLLPTRKVAITTGEWGPMVVQSDSSGGPTIQLARSVLASAGFDPVVSFTTWNTAYDRVGRGEAFAAVPVVASAARSRNFTLSSPFLSVEYRIFYNRLRMDGRTISGTELKTRKAAFLAGYDYWPSATTDFPNVAHDRDGNLYSAQAAFAALRDGTVDLVFEGLEQGRFLAQSDRFVGDQAQFSTIPPYRASELGFPVSQEAPLHFLFAKSLDSKIVSKVNDAIIKFKMTDEYRELESESLGCLNTKASWQQPSNAGQVYSTSGAAFTISDGTDLRVIMWGDQETRCPEARSLSVPAGAALVKVWSGPHRGNLAIVSTSSLATGGS